MDDIVVNDCVELHGHKLTRRDDDSGGHVHVAKLQAARDCAIQLACSECEAVEGSLDEHGEAEERRGKEHGGQVHWKLLQLHHPPVLVEVETVAEVKHESESQYIFACVC
jgi:hypothetical protein